MVLAEDAEKGEGAFGYYKRMSAVTSDLAHEITDYRPFLQKVAGLFHLLSIDAPCR
jgi:hypothetical protein